MIILIGIKARAEAAALTGNPNISWSPDGQAFTTDAGEPGRTSYGMGYTVTTGTTSTKEELQTGQHYYDSKREGEIPIEKWVVSYEPGRCIHNGYPDAENENFHGIDYGRQICKETYKSGWLGTCADCGQAIHMLFYMDKETAESLKYLPTDYDYYYLCPHCSNLEQGAPIQHRCRNEISWNRYTISYDKNLGIGYMDKSTFMYNNVTTYEGDEITPETKLKKNTFYRKGFEFIGWNTKRDGSGRDFADGQVVWNLTTVNKENITLYAQWKKSESTLQIDPAGGTFAGRSGITSIKQGYGSTFSAAGEKVTPPRGNKLQCVTNGGTPVADMYATKYFLYWQQSNPFHGRMEGESYTFLGADGAADTITACYGSLPVTLPETDKPGCSFGGWYKDPECTIPAGTAGEEIIITEDTVLYAKWVSLQLTAADNYTAFGGSGAADLSWMQADSTAKTYKLYQSRDGINWQRLSFNGTVSPIGVAESFTATKTRQTYTVPHSGIYTLTATGAQGTGYGSYAGGKGGRVSATVWLSKGEVLTYAIGTTDGYNGGGGGSVYGTGGGMTSVSSDQKGLLMVAGGGGGASPAGSGGAGGASTSLRADGQDTGAGGHAGGGGGYVGGNAGELIKHEHKPECYLSISTAYTFTDFAAYSNNSSGDINNYSGTAADHYNGMSGHTGADQYKAYIDIKVGSAKKLIATNGNKTVEIPFYIYNWGAGVDNKSYIAVYDQNAVEIGRLILRDGWQDINNDIVSTTYTYENHTAFLTIKGTWKVALSDTTTGIYVAARENINGNDEGCWATFDLGNFVFSGGTSTMKICEYEEDQLISSKPAYGGSNYINTGYCTVREDVPGVGAGDGSLALSMTSADYIDSLSLPAVAAKDMASPAPVDVGSVQKLPSGGEAVRVQWNAPADYGTEYIHRAESYRAADGTKLCDSNITSNTLTSGTAGYYYLTDETSDTSVNKVNGSFTTANGVTISLTADVQYLHLAAVDVAGNLSDTVHIQLGHRDTDVAWGLRTGQTGIRGFDNNVYAAPEEKTWYVRADGETPFLMVFHAAMEHEALETYQINHMIFDISLESDGSCQRHDVYTSSHSITEGDIVSGVGELEKSTSGIAILRDAAYTVTTRRNKCRDMDIAQNFTLSPEYDAQLLTVVPVTGAEHQEGIVYSAWEEDATHGICLIGDALAPTVQGTELLADLIQLDRDNGPVLVDLTCEDAGSGVREFYMEVTNLDNFITKTFYADADGHLRVDLTAADDFVFNGDYNVVIHAVDNVGNDSRLLYSTCEFSLYAYVTRMLEPHDPVFRRGETGILHIITTGYVDRVEVEAVDPLIPEGKTYLYRERDYLKEETEEFFIPLNAEEKTYVFRVRAYKDGKCLTVYPKMGVLEVAGTVLDDFRRKILWNE